MEWYGEHWYPRMSTSEPTEPRNMLLAVAHAGSGLSWVIPGWGSRERRDNVILKSSWEEERGQRRHDDRN